MDTGWNATSQSSPAAATAARTRERRSANSSGVKSCLDMGVSDRWSGDRRPPDHDGSERRKRGRHRPAEPLHVQLVERAVEGALEDEGVEPAQQVVLADLDSDMGRRTPQGEIEDRKSTRLKSSH